MKRIALCCIIGLCLVSARGEVIQDTARIQQLHTQARKAISELHMDLAVQLIDSAEALLTNPDSFFYAKKIAFLQMRGSILWHQDFYDDAEVLIRQALEIAKAHFPRESMEQAWAYYDVAWINQQTFDLEEWKSYLDTAAMLFPLALDEDDCLQGLIWQHRARMNYFSFGSQDTTLAYLRRATPSLSRCTGENDRFTYELLSGYYDAFLSLRQFDSAEHYLNKQLQMIATKPGATWNLQRNWLEMSKAQVYRLNGEYEKAIDHYENILARIDDNPEDSTQWLNCYIYKAWCTSELGMHREAIDEFERLIDFAAGYSKITWDFAGLLYEGAAKAYAAAGYHDTAVYAAQQSLDAFSHMIRSGNVKLLSLYLTAGNSLLEMNQAADALEMLKHAQTIVSQFGKTHPRTVQVDLLRASAYLKVGNGILAKQLLDSISQTGTLLQHPDLAYAHAITSAQLILQKPHVSDADRSMLIDLVRDAMQSFGQIRNQYLAEEARARSVTTSIRSLHALLPALVELHQLKPGDDLFDLLLQLSETHRGLLLAEAIGQSQRFALHGIPAGIRERERQIKFSLSQTRKKIDQEYTRQMPKREYVARLQEEQIHLRNALDSVFREFKSMYPEYYQARFAQAQYRFDQVKQQLNPSTGLIEYLVTEDLLSALLITQDEHRFVMLGSATVAEKLAAGFHDAMTQRKSSPQRQEQLRLLGDSLYTILIRPFEELLKELTVLIIVPDRALHYLPFEALTIPGKTDPVDQYLLAQYSISYQPSIRLWMESVQEESERIVQSSLTVSPAFQHVGPGDRGGALFPLEYAAEESRQVHALWGGKYFAGAKANKQRFLANASSSDLIHLATHARADDRTGDFSWLAFSPVANDSFLYLDEIYSLDLDAELVVLSGCETGIGPWQTGEGLISLSRAFTYAGANAIVTSLWPVQDAATAQIMTAFHTHLRSGETKDRALQLAKLEYLSNVSDPLQADPYYWAGFIPMGEMAALTPVPEKSSALIWIPVIGAVLVLGWLVVRWKKKKDALA